MTWPNIYGVVVDKNLHCSLWYIFYDVTQIRNNLLQNFHGHKCIKYD